VGGAGLGKFGRRWGKYRKGSGGDSLEFHESCGRRRRCTNGFSRLYFRKTQLLMSIQICGGIGVFSVSHKENQWEIRKASQPNWAIYEHLCVGKIIKKINIKLKTDI